MQSKGIFYLMITAIIWGTSFVAQKLGMNHVEPFTFNAVRFLLGSLVLLGVIYFMRRRRRRRATDELTVESSRSDLLKAGLLCGGAMFMAASTQQIGIVHTTAGKAGFITALYIVLVPILGLFYHKRVGKITWGSVGLAVVGLYLLSVKGDFTMARGDAIVLTSTLFWALQIVFVDLYGKSVDGVELSFLQFLIAGLLSLPAAFIFETPQIGLIIEAMGPILYGAVMVVGVAFTFQILGQKTVQPTLAAIIMSLESVFAVISGALFLSESLTPRELIGCTLMFTAVVLCQLDPGNRSIKEEVSSPLGEAS